MVVVHYYSSLVYMDLICRQTTTLIYGKCFREVTSQTIQIWDSHLHVIVMDWNNAEQDV